MSKTLISPNGQLIRSKRKLLFIGGAIISILWAILYLPFLRSSPPWYGDEFFTLNIGLPMTHGELTNRALVSTFFSYAFNYQPGFTLCAGLFSRLNSGDILGGRILCTLIGLATALTGFWFIFRRFGFYCGLFFAVFFLSYPQSIIHYRWIYPHGMVGLALIAAVGLLMRPANPREDWKVGAVLILGVSSHLLGVYATATAAACRALRPRSWLPVILPSALFILGVFFALNIYLQGWPAEDLVHLLKRYELDSAQSGGGLKILQNYGIFFFQDYFHVFALIGFFLCLRRRTYMLCMISLMMSFFLLRNRQNLTYFYYQALVILPILAALASIGLYQLISIIARRFSLKRNSIRILQSGSAFLCILFGLLQLPAVLGEKLPVRISPWVVSSIPDYESAASWLNNRTNPDDLVITYWNLGWMLHCRNADILMATAWTGLPGGDLLDPAPARERFRYPLDIQLAKYFVITELDELWAFRQRSVPTVLENSKVLTWPLVFQAGTVRILRNPNL